MKTLQVCVTAVIIYVKLQNLNVDIFVIVDFIIMLTYWYRLLYTADFYGSWLIHRCWLFMRLTFSKSFCLPAHHCAINRWLRVCTPIQQNYRPPLRRRDCHFDVVYSYKSSVFSLTCYRNGHRSCFFPIDFQLCLYSHSQSPHNGLLHLIIGWQRFLWACTLCSMHNLICILLMVVRVGFQILR